jgi:general secretion pathway protein C
MRTRLLSLAVWALVALAATFWGLKLGAGGPGLPAHAQAPTRSVPNGGGWHRLMGNSVVAAEDDDEEASGDDSMQLLGVVAPRGAERSPQGVALISVGGQPAKAYRTGAEITEDLVLLSVGRRSASLGPRGGPADTELRLPEPVRSGATVVSSGFGPRPLPQPGAIMQPGGVIQPGHAVRPMGQPGDAVRAPQPARPQAADDDEEDE